MSAEKTKVPGHFFQWFESLKQGYENSINRLFNRVEEVNEDHKTQIKQVYQAQIDSLKKSYQEHLHAIKDSHKQQMVQAQSRINQLQQDTQFYQDQIKTQHQTIDRLNDRYDAVLFALTDKMDSKELENVIKDISPTQFDEDRPSLQHQQTEQTENDNALSGPLAPENRNKASHPFLDKEPNQQANESQASEPAPEPAAEPEQSQEQTAVNVLQKAFDARSAQQYEQAYALFLEAAKSGDGKAMGAIGRAHFVGEGTNLDKHTGLAWLIKAAEADFAPASKKVESAREKTPQMFETAKQIAQGLLT